MIAIITKIKKQWNYLRFTTKLQQAFLDDLMALMNDGISANQSIELMSYMSKGVVTKVVDDVLLAIAQGKLIADGLTQWFPAYIVEIIRAGEASGTLTSAMESAVVALGRKNYTLTTVVMSLAYPIAVIVMGFAVIVFLNNSIFHDFKTILPIDQWPMLAQILVAFAVFLQRWWWTVIVIISLLLISTYYLLHNYIGSLRSYFDRIPLISNFRSLTAARLLETLGLLTNNGLLIKQALHIIKEHASPYLNWHIMAMEYRLASGRDNLGEILDTGLVAEADIFRLRVIAKGRDISSALIRLGERASINTNKHLQHNARFTGIVFLCIGAGLAGLMILSIYGVGAAIANSVH